jgi:hypothetical protein
MRTVRHLSLPSFLHGSRLAAVVATIFVVIGAAILHIRSNRVEVSKTGSDVALAHWERPSEPLTLRNANAWLETAPSVKKAMDDLAFRSQVSPITEGKQSAIAVLSKERGAL